MNRRQHIRQFALLLLCIIAALLRIALTVQPGLWADEILSLAIATGQSLEHPAADADPSLGDFVEPAQAQTPVTFNRYYQHETSLVGAGRVIRVILPFRYQSPAVLPASQCLDPRQRHP